MKFVSTTAGEDTDGPTGLGTLGEFAAGLRISELALHVPSTAAGAAADAGADAAAAGAAAAGADAAEEEEEDEAWVRRLPFTGTCRCCLLCIFMPAIDRSLYDCRYTRWWSK